MNKGVEILLSRMDSNPDEFLTGNKSGKWQHLLEKYEEYMDEDERKTVFTKYHSLKMGKFTEAVMKELLEEQEEAPNPFVQAAMSGAGLTHAQSMAAQNSIVNTVGTSTLSFRDPNTLANSISVGGETLTAKMIKKLKRLLK